MWKKIIGDENPLLYGDLGPVIMKKCGGQADGNRQEVCGGGLDCQFAQTIDKMNILSFCLTGGRTAPYNGAHRNGAERPSRGLRSRRREEQDMGQKAILMAGLLTVALSACGGPFSMEETAGGEGALSGSQALQSGDGSACSMERSLCGAVYRRREPVCGVSGGVHRRVG